NHLLAHKTLSRDEAYNILTQIAQGTYQPTQVAAFITVYLMRSITVEELRGFRDAMLELCIPVRFPGVDPIDLCGTGGDSKDTFNISTLASFVTAAAGIPVAKHGNYGVSSVSGSSNMIEHFGGRFSNDPDFLHRCMEEANICFLHAPLFHPAMKHVAPIRRELGVKTFFNMLGPMVNPASPRLQLVGVFSLELARLYAYLYQQSGKQFMILHTLDGYDEVSLTAPCKVITGQGEQLITPEQLGMSRLAPPALAGGDSVAAAGEIFMRVLRGEDTPARRSVVIANAGMAIHCARPELSREDALALAAETLDAGRALDTFRKYLQICN
ncbi:MAG: anthranilate phosphoribosyltransferase, partial [Bacteroidia bacterium]|nr:anthranilate phosphoribosyltransferase [Bacteroidia bacterium]